MSRTPFVHIAILIAFIINSFGPVPARAQELNLPKPGVMIHLSPELTPAHLVGMSIHPDNALRFDFLINRGDDPLSDPQKKEQYTKLVKYFLASLTVPDQDQWVNLSPYEKDRIIKDDFGKTEMGRDLLAQDYILKQITSSLIYPEEKLGKKFWDKVYKRSWEEFHTTNVPVNTFNKVWIIPDEAAVYESGNTVYVLRNHLKVMLEEDYMSLQKHLTAPTDTHSIGSQIVREVVLPELEREVNEGKNFAPLRQIYSGMILATWYKHALKESLLGKVYANKAKVKGVDQDNPKANEEIYQQYLKAFKKGVFNYIKEDVDKYSKETVPRKYFSGGTEGFFGISPAMAEGFKPRIVMEVNAGNSDKLPANVRESLSSKDSAQAADQTDSAMVDLTSSNGTPTAVMTAAQLYDSASTLINSHATYKYFLPYLDRIKDDPRKLQSFITNFSDQKLFFSEKLFSRKDALAAVQKVFEDSKIDKSWEPYIAGGNKQVFLVDGQIVRVKPRYFHINTDLRLSGRSEADYVDSIHNDRLTARMANIDGSFDGLTMDVVEPVVVLEKVYDDLRGSFKPDRQKFLKRLLRIFEAHPLTGFGFEEDIKNAGLVLRNTDQGKMIYVVFFDMTRDPSEWFTAEQEVAFRAAQPEGIPLEEVAKYVPEVLTLKDEPLRLPDSSSAMAHNLKQSPSAAMKAPSVWDRWSKERTVNFKSKSEGSITFRIFVPDDQKTTMLEKGGSVRVEARTSKGMLIARYETTKGSIPIEAVEETIKDVDGYFQRESYDLIPFNSKDFLTSLDRYLTSMPFIQYRVGGYEVRFKKVSTPTTGIIKQSGGEPVYKVSAAMKNDPSLWRREITVQFRAKEQEPVRFRVFVSDFENGRIFDTDYRGGSIQIEAFNSNGRRIARYESTLKNISPESMQQAIRLLGDFLESQSKHSSFDYFEGGRPVIDTSLDIYLKSWPFIQQGSFELKFDRIFAPTAGVIRQSGDLPVFKGLSAAMSTKTFTRLMAVLLVVDTMVGGYLWNKYSDNGPRATPVLSEELEDPLFPTIERINLIPAAVSVSKIFDEKKVLQEANKLINKFPDFFKGNHKIRNVADLYPYATDFTAFYSDENYDLYDRNVAFAAVLHSFMDSNDKGGKEQYNQYTLSMLLNSKYDLRRSGGLDDVEERADALARIMGNPSFNLNDSESIQWIKTPAVQKEIEHLLESIPEKEGLVRKHLDYLYYSLAKQMSEDGKSRSEYMDMIHLFNADNVPFLLNEWVNLKDVLKAGLFDQGIFQVIPWLKDPSVLDFMAEFDDLYKVDDVKDLEYMYKKNVYRYFVLKALAFKKEGKGQTELSQFVKKMVTWGLFRLLAADDISLTENFIRSRRIFEQMLQEGRKDPSKNYVVYMVSKGDHNNALFLSPKNMKILWEMYGDSFLYLDANTFNEMMDFTEKVRLNTAPLKGVMIDAHMNPISIFEQGYRITIFSPFFDIRTKAGVTVIGNDRMQALRKRFSDVLLPEGNVWIMGCSGGGSEVSIEDLNLVAPGKGQRIFDSLVSGNILTSYGVLVDEDKGKLSDVLKSLNGVSKTELFGIRRVIEGALWKMNVADVISYIFGDRSTYAAKSPVLNIQFNEKYEISFLTNYIGSSIPYVGKFYDKMNTKPVVVLLPKPKSSSIKKPTPAPPKSILKKFRSSSSKAMAIISLDEVKSILNLRGQRRDLSKQIAALEATNNEMVALKPGESLLDKMRRLSSREFLDKSKEEEELNLKRNELFNQLRAIEEKLGGRGVSEEVILYVQGLRRELVQLQQGIASERVKGDEAANTHLQELLTQASIKEIELNDLQEVMDASAAMAAFPLNEKMQLGDGESRNRVLSSLRYLDDNFNRNFYDYIKEFIEGEKSFNDLLGEFYSRFTLSHFQRYKDVFRYALISAYLASELEGVDFESIYNVLPTIEKNGVVNLDVQILQQAKELLRGTKAHIRTYVKQHPRRKEAFRLALSRSLRPALAVMALLAAGGGVFYYLNKPKQETGVVDEGSGSSWDKDTRITINIDQNRDNSKIASEVGTWNPKAEPGSKEYQHAENYINNLIAIVKEPLEGAKLSGRQLRAYYDLQYIAGARIPKELIDFLVTEQFPTVCNLKVNGIGELFISSINIIAINNNAFNNKTIVQMLIESKEVDNRLLVALKKDLTKDQIQDIWSGTNKPNSFSDEKWEILQAISAQKNLPKEIADYIVENVFVMYSGTLLNLVQNPNLSYSTFLNFLLKKPYQGNTDIRNSLIQQDPIARFFVDIVSNTENNLTEKEMKVLVKNLSEFDSQLKEWKKLNPQRKIPINPKGKSIKAVIDELIKFIQGTASNQNLGKSRMALAGGIENMIPDLRTNGGIDMNSANLNLQIKRDGKGVPLPLAQQDLFKLNSIEGFVPVIIDIKPAADLPIFSELQQKFRPTSTVLASAA